MKPKTDIATKTQTLVDAAIALYLADGNDHTVPELAAHLGWSESSVRTVLNSNGGCPNALTNRQEGRDSFSKSFRGMSSGVHLVRVYGPSRDTLRALLLAAKATPSSLAG